MSLVIISGIDNCGGIASVTPIVAHELPTCSGRTVDEMFSQMAEAQPEDASALFRELTAYLEQLSREKIQYIIRVASFQAALDLLDSALRIQWLLLYCSPRDLMAQVISTKGFSADRIPGVLHTWYDQMNALYSIHMAHRESSMLLDVRDMKTNSTMFEDSFRQHLGVEIAISESAAPIENTFPMVETISELILQEYPQLFDCYDEVKAGGTFFGDFTPTFPKTSSEVRKMVCKELDESGRSLQNFRDRMQSDLDKSRLEIESVNQISRNHDSQIKELGDKVLLLESELEVSQLQVQQLQQVLDRGSISDEGDSIGPDVTIETLGPKINTRLEVAEKKIEPTLCISIADLNDPPNFHDIESSVEGILFRWTGPGNQNNLEVELDRSSKGALTIYVVAVVKKAYLKKLSILIDGNPVKHRINKSEGQLVIRCQLPPRKDQGTTSLGIVLPQTHSPFDLELSEDQRYLGIAISHIDFKPTSRSFIKLLNREQ